MLENAYLLAKIGADTAESERNFAEILPKIGNYPARAEPRSATAASTLAGVYWLHLLRCGRQTPQRNSRASEKKEEDVEVTLCSSPQNRSLRCDDACFGSGEGG